MWRYSELVRRHAQARAALVEWKTGVVCGGREYWKEAAFFDRAMDRRVDSIPLGWYIQELLEVPSVAVACGGTIWQSICEDESASFGGRTVSTVLRRSVWRSRLFVESQGHLSRPYDTHTQVPSRRSALKERKCN
jgi:hypothetical protein